MPLPKSSLENNVYEDEESPYPRPLTAKDKDRNGLDGLGSCENAQSVIDDKIFCGPGRTGPVFPQRSPPFPPLVMPPRKSNSNGSN
jgi:hypothetical protein